MYRQIEIDESQRQFQLIVWREHLTDPLRIYQLNTVTYGTASAPFLAIKVQLSDLCAKSQPVASRVLSQDFYVDDLLTGADSLEELDSMRRQLVEMLDSAGFTLAKWASNSTLRPLNSSDGAVALREHGDTKNLGLIWNPRADLFKYSLQEVEQNENPTKSTSAVTTEVDAIRGYVFGQESENNAVASRRAFTQCSIVTSSQVPVDNAKRMPVSCSSRNLEVDAVVLIHEDNVPSQNWLLGVVMDVVKGADGKVRVAVVKTKCGVYKRAIHRLAPLPKA
ncbi:hypothetical protein ACLKA6_009771 [Drosophila palustris]